MNSAYSANIEPTHFVIKSEGSHVVVDYKNGTVTIDGDWDAVAKEFWEFVGKKGHSYVERIAELEAALDEERKRRGALQFNHDYLQRGCADDALTIHTCEEIIDRTKKELGTYRELHFDNIKRIAELEAENANMRAALEEIADFEPDCDCKTYQYCPCLSCTAKKALGRGMWAET